MGDDLSERKKQILRAVVDAHIRLGEPVGSKFLTQSNALTCSPATVRNEMAELEEMGYLEQPHTSAGRVPSVAGYRYYVDALLRQYDETSREIGQIQAALRGKIAELDSIMTQASRLASSITNYTGLSVKKVSTAAIRQFEIMYVDSRTFVLMMLASGNSVKSRSIRSSVELERGDTERLASLLNQNLKGLTAEQITLPLIYAVETAMEDKPEVVSPVMKAICETLNELDEGEMTVDGLNHLLEYPEYADVEQLRGLMSLMDSKNDLMNVITGDDDSDQVHVYIGSENAVDAMKNSALVFRTVRRDGKPIGAIGVIGPCRMDYSRVIATVNQIANGIGDLLDSGQPAHLPPGDTDKDKHDKQ